MKKKKNKINKKSAGKGINKAKGKKKAANQSK